MCPAGADQINFTGGGGRTQKSIWAPSPDFLNDVNDVVPGKDYRNKVQQSPDLPAIKYPGRVQKPARP